MSDLDLQRKGTREIVIRRSFNAPRAALFAALTEPAQLKRWMAGPEGWSFAVCEVDLQVGGHYRYVWRGPGGAELGITGDFRVIEPPARIVSTERFDEAWAGSQTVGTLELSETAPGITHVTTTVFFEEEAAREAAFESDMGAGMAAGYARLDQLLAEGTPPVG